ncbi:MAG TPA: PASTA domain-containing protein [Amycolatopsis sp.]|nr:PASTA domain-containing protein [Amycolatopsis sp.]
MDGEESRWQAGEHAWRRLSPWARNPADGDPLAALGDVGELRRLLDGVELEAVRAARRAGKSWAEIATKLGVTRQSAWERWRDLDGELGAPEPLSAAARFTRRRSQARVPNVVGLTFGVAQAALGEAGLVGVAADFDTPVDTTRIITDQSPESGARTGFGATVRLWTRRPGGGAGVREPRRPKPTPPAERERLEEPREEALG